MEKFRVYWSNFNYYAPDEFNTLEEAISYGESKNFEFVASEGEVSKYFWSPIYGGRMI